MLSDFFRINMPYGMAKNADGDWMVFNRAYTPIGFNDPQPEASPIEAFSNLPVYSQYKGITDKLLNELEYSDTAIHRNEKGEIVKIYLYQDSDIADMSSGKNPQVWTTYFEKIQKLSKS